MVEAALVGFRVRGLRNGGYGCCRRRGGALRRGCAMNKRPEKGNCRESEQGKRRCCVCRDARAHEPQVNPRASRATVLWWGHNISLQPGATSLAAVFCLS